MLRRCFILLIIGLGLTVTPPIRAQIYVSDDFEDPNRSKALWEIISGDWKVDGGLFHQLARGDPWLVAMIAEDRWNEDWTEYTIEVSAAQLDAGDHPLNILFRVQEPVPRTWAERDAPQTHMYRWIVNGWTNTLSRPYIYNGGNRTMLAEKAVTLEIGKFYRLKLEVTGEGFRGFIDDEEIFDVKHAEWTKGRVGLQSFGGLADFDDFVVYGPKGVSVKPQDKLAMSWGKLKTR
jgi:hypothetical protein